MNVQLINFHSAGASARLVTSRSPLELRLRRLFAGHATVGTVLPHKLLAALHIATVPVLGLIELNRAPHIPRARINNMSSQADYLSHLEYVKHNSRSGTYKLRKTHVYYHQATDYIGLAGSAWKILCCHSGFHCERMYYDAHFFPEMLEKLNLFHSNFHLISSVKSFVWSTFVEKTY